jgi:phage-related protein
MANPSIVVDFVADTSGLKKGLRDAQGGTSSFGSKLKSLGKAGALAAGAAGVGALVETLHIGIKEWTESTKVAAQTNAVIKSTGGVAKVTAGHVDDLAGSLLKKTGIDDEAIKSGENLLLTFTNIRNEVGKGNDVFDQTTKAATDMSVALGTDVSSAAMQLGKALNDPEKGMSRLMRTGVSFTQAQKDQVKALQDSGHTLEAQKIILKEVNKEFGGSAEAAGKTLPGQINILKETFNNLAGDLVGKLVPVLETAIGFLRDHWPEISKTIQDTWTQVIQPTLKALADVVTAVVQLVVDHWNLIGPIVDAVAITIRDSVRVITDILKLLAALLRGDWSQAWVILQKTVTDAVTLIRDKINLTLLPLKIVLDVLWSGIKASTQAIWSAITGAVSTAVGAIKGAFDDLVGFLRGLGQRIGSAFDAVRTWLGKPGQWAEDAVSAVKGAFNGLIGYFTGLAGNLAKPITAVANAIKGPINAVISAWNSIEFTIPKINIPSVSIAGKKIGGGSFGGESFGVPNIPLLAKGGIVTSPTLAMVGEAGPEAVIPLGAGGAPIEVRVFIGETELRGIVRTEVIGENNRTAQVLLAGV